MTNSIRLSLLLSLSIAAFGARGSDFDVQAWIDEQVAANGVLAVTAAHLEDGRVRHYAGGSLAPGSDTAADENTQFEIGSITKAFTNLLLAEMVEKDLVGYETTIGELLGDDVSFANPAVADITLMQLATHTSGLARLPANLQPTDPLDPYKGYDEAAVLAGLAMARDKQPLGRHYSYSNFGVGVLGYLLGRVHGGGYTAAMHEHVIGPLGMHNSGFDRADHSAKGFRDGQVVPDWSLDVLAGAGSLRSTTSDLMHVASIHLGETENPLAHDLAADRDVMNAAGGFDVTRVWHVGEADDGRIFWHNGGTGGFWSFFGWKPAAGEAVAILVSGDPDPTGIGLQWLGYVPTEPPATDVDETLFGQYDINPSFGIGIYEIDGSLIGQASGQPPFELYAVGDDWFAIGVADGSLRFVREDGRVVALELAQNGTVQRADRTADTAATLARKEVEVPREQLAAYVGEYPAQQPPITFTIRLAGSGLEAQVSGQPFYPIFAKGDDRFFYKVVDAELHFERDADKNVDALVLHQGGAVIRAEKSD
ncbi:MAG: serine hydrolase [Proteobacteria bacterium]|nr:serine hydrolase [Pseudomonadota bacterium]